MSAIDDWEAQWEKNKAILAAVLTRPVEITLPYYDVRKAFEQAAKVVESYAFEAGLDEPVQNLRLVLVSTAFIPGGYREDEYAYTFKAEASV